MGLAIAILGFVLFTVGLIVYVFVDFFLRRFKNIFEFADSKKYLETMSVRVLCAGFVIMWIGIALASAGF